VSGRAEGDKVASSKTEVEAVETADLKEGALGEMTGSERFEFAFAVSAAARLAKKSDGRPAENAIETGRSEREGAVKAPLRIRWFGSGVGVEPNATRLADEGRVVVG